LTCIVQDVVFGPLPINPDAQQGDLSGKAIAGLVIGVVIAFMLIMWCFWSGGKCGLFKREHPIRTPTSMEAMVAQPAPAYMSQPTRRSRQPSVSASLPGYEGHEESGPLGY
jgi:hypothetical protein